MFKYILINKILNLKIEVAECDLVDFYNKYLKYSNNIICSTKEQVLEIIKNYQDFTIEIKEY